MNVGKHTSTFACIQHCTKPGQPIFKRSMLINTAVRLPANVWSRFLDRYVILSCPSNACNWLSSAHTSCSPFLLARQQTSLFICSAVGQRGDKKLPKYFRKNILLHVPRFVFACCFIPVSLAATGEGSPLVKALAYHAAAPGSIPGRCITLARRFLPESPAC